MKNNKVRLKDIAEKTGFTINTVSRALLDKDDISEATKKIIAQAADELGYIRDTVASYMRTGVTRNLAIILGDISNLLFSIWIKEIERCAHKYKYNTIIFNTEEEPEAEREAIVSALSKKVDGILLCPAQKSSENIQFLAGTGVPFVLIGRRYTGENFNYVVSDDEKGGYLATQHLIQKGHRSILMLNSKYDISSSIERKAGYMRALKEADIPYNKELVRRVSPVAGGASLGLRKILSSKPDFTGIFAFSDLIALETIYTLNEMGVRVPQEIGIVGCDNVQEHVLLPVPLDTVTNVGDTVPKCAVEILMEMIQKKNPVHKQMVLDVKLKLRGSAGDFNDARI